MAGITNFLIQFVVFFYAEQGELIIVFMDRPVRKSPRLKGYDYSLCGAYFLTICTYKFQNLFGKIYFTLQENSIDLSHIGAAVQKNLDALPERFPDFEILNYVIMPNHLHILVLKVDLGTSKNRTISDFVCALKSLTTREIRLNYPSKQIWKESFHDHIIRNDRDLAIHWDYIEQNVNRWQKDKYFNSQIDH